MPGIRALRYIQMGVETTSGTAVAATSRWRGKGTIEDRLEQKFVEEDIAYVSGVDRAYIPKQLAAISFDETEATFEQVPYIGSSGVKALDTGVQDGTGTDYIYAYTFPTTAVNTVKTRTIEGGDDQQEEEMEYSFVEAFKLTGKAEEALMMQADWLGRQVAPSTKTAALALPTVEDILFQKGKLYIDAVSGTLGGTQKSNTFLGMELSVKTGWIPVFTGDGNLYFSFAKSTMPEIMLDITFEHDASSVSEKASWRAGTSRQIRIKFEGNTVATPGTTYSKKTLLIDLAGKWEKFDKLDEQNGNDIVKGSFRARYNATAALFANMTVVNELSALP